MYEYKVHELEEMLTAMIAASRDLSTADQLEKEYFTDERSKALALVLDGLRIVCNKLEADASLIDQIATFSRELALGKADRREAVVSARVDAIIAGVKNNLETRRFMYMPADEAAYWENPFIFGDEFLVFFPKAAKWELREVGNCFASSRWTACVFHCMRVAEYGLRMLARNLRVTITDKNAHCPLEYGAWDKVIQAIRNKITESRKLPVGQTKERSLQFHASAADACEYMKDIWRNETAHARRLYNKQEALAVMNRVREFSQLMGRNAAEKKTRNRVANSR